MPSFYVEYAEPIDAEGLEQGNEFLLAGTVQGTREFTPLIGSAKRIPLFKAECLRVWKTAGTDLASFTAMDPLDLRYPPPLTETYCIPQ